VEADPVPDAVRPTASASESELRAALVRSIARVHARGWCEATAGNFSAVATRDPLRLLVTPSGVDKGGLAPGDFVTVDARGEASSRSAGRPSAEVGLHVALVEEAGAGAVFHTHSPWATLLGERFLAAGGIRLGGYEMLKALAGRTSHDQEHHLPILANTQDLPALAARVRGLVRAEPGLCGFLVAGHGLYAWGGGIDEAARHLEALEFLLGLVGRRARLDPFPVPAPQEIP
jgi:methylthioribulose-1-phosphate dehydratase